MSLTQRNIYDAGGVIQYDSECKLPRFIPKGPGQYEILPNDGTIIIDNGCSGPNAGQVLVVTNPDLDDPYRYELDFYNKYINGATVGIRVDNHMYFLQGEAHRSLHLYYMNAIYGWVCTDCAVPVEQTIRIGVPATAILSSTPVMFGYSAAVSEDGTFLVVGGPGDNNGVGAAWVYSKEISGSTSSWVLKGKLTPSGATSAAPRFGTQVAISPNYLFIAVSAPNDNSADGTITGTGTVWIYLRIGLNWVAVSTIQPSTVASDGFGTGLQFNKSGTDLVITSSGNSTTAPRMWVAQRKSTSNGWEITSPYGGPLTLPLPASTTAPTAGVSIDFDSTGSTCIISGHTATNSNGSDGCAWAVFKTPIGWNQHGDSTSNTLTLQTFLSQSDSMRFSQSLAVTKNGAQVIMGIPGDMRMPAINADPDTKVGGGTIDTLALDAGSGVWVSNGNTLHPPWTDYNGSVSSYAPAEFGRTLCMTPDDRFLIVCAPYALNEKGAIHMYMRETTKSSWQYMTDLDISDTYEASADGTTPGSRAGYHSLRISGNGKTLVVGSGYFNSKNGSIWIYG